MNNDIKIELEFYFTFDGYNKLLKYAGKLTRYLEGCLE